MGDWRATVGGRGAGLEEHDMDFLTDVLRLLGPYGVTAIGTTFLGYGLLAGLLLIRVDGRPYVRPYFMSAFGMAVVCFLLATTERSLPPGLLVIVKLIVCLVALIYGVALLRRARIRPLVRRRPLSFVLIGALAVALPLAPGLMGTIVKRAAMLRAVSSSNGEAAVEIVTRTGFAIWVPLGVATGGALLIGCAVLIILVLLLRAQPRVDR